MSLRLRWKSSDFDEEAAFPLRGGALALLCLDDSGALDRVAEIPDGASGIVVGEPDADGRLDLHARGQLQFLADESTFRKVRIKPGGRVAFESGAWSGTVSLEGSAPKSDPLVGKELGGYKVLGRLGAGGVGVVYRALQINLDREVALKVLNPKEAEKPVMVASFHREAQAAGRLSHPNLVQVHDVGKADGLHFFSMEIVPGGNLEEQLEESGPMSWENAVAAIRDCAMALAYAQEHDLVHRDVKPENLMVSGSGHLKLADLGLAATRGLLDKDVAGGTPHFMAPEAFGGREIDGRADHYSLGCTLYRLLTGETVFPVQGVREILRAHRESSPPTIPSEVGAPPELEKLLAELLDKNPDNRPSVASEVVERCSALLAKKVSRKSLAAAAVVAVAAIGWATWQALQPATEPETKTVVEYVQVGDEGAAQKALQLSMELAWTQASAISDASKKIGALEAFLLEFPAGPFALNAQEELARLVKERDDALARDAAEAEAVMAKWAQLEADVSGHLSDTRPYLAYVALAESGLENSEKAVAIRKSINDAAQSIFAQGEMARTQGLKDGDPAASFAATVFLEEAFRGSDGEVGEPWATKILEKRRESKEYFASVQRAAFQADRSRLIGVLDNEITNGLVTLTLGAGVRSWSKACDELSHPELAKLARRESSFLLSAARAADALRSSLRASEDLFAIEPNSNKRVRVLGLEGEGLSVSVQVRGERVKRVDPLRAWLKPETFSGLLRAALSPSRPPEEACALHLLAGEFQLAKRIGAWDSLPSAEEFASLAQEAQQWVNRIPRKLTAYPDWYTRHLDMFESVKRFASAAAQGDFYSGELELAGLAQEVSLLGIWASDGTSHWGLNP